MRKEIINVNDFTEFIYKELNGANSNINNVSLTVYPMVLDGEKVNADVLKISVKTDTEVSILKENVGRITDNYFIEESNLYIEIIDLIDYLKKHMNEDIIESYDIFEANIKGEFLLYLGFDLVQ